MTVNKKLIFGVLGIGIALAAGNKLVPSLDTPARLVDYKFWYVKRDDNVHISEAAVRFYLGAVTTEDQEDKDGNIIPVTRYRRTQRVVKFPNDFRRFSKDSNNNVVKIYTSEDFGIISTDDELRLFLNGELAKVSSFLQAAPVPEQTGSMLK